MTIPGDIIIPALTFRTAGGELDEATTARYAETAAGTWLDYFILSGTTTEGDTFTVDERAQVLDIWLKATDRSRLVACCWTRDDIDAALERGIRPMAVMRGLRDEDEAIAFFRTLPAGAFVYSHPLHTPTTITPRLVLESKGRHVLPAGAKISKLPAEDLSSISSIVGPAFVIWDGSARRLQESFRRGGAGIVATPLAMLPRPFPPREPQSLLPPLNRNQGLLDNLGEGARRAEWLREEARRYLADQDSPRLGTNTGSGDWDDTTGDT